jgi:hypothetical protein
MAVALDTHGVFGGGGSVSGVVDGVGSTGGGSSATLMRAAEVS